MEFFNNIPLGISFFCKLDPTYVGINLIDRKFQSEKTASEWRLGQLKQKIMA
tara:strand:- start:194 stop:349 length:156 start_codon:yes stop_codon:yes gene_type:complete